MFFLYNLQESQWQGWEENHEYCKTDCEKISYYNMGSDEATETLYKVNLQMKPLP